MDSLQAMLRDQIPENCGLFALNVFQRLQECGVLLVYGFIADRFAVLCPEVSGEAVSADVVMIQNDDDERAHGRRRLVCGAAGEKHRDKHQMSDHRMPQYVITMPRQDPGRFRHFRHSDRH